MKDSIVHLTAPCMTDSSFARETLPISLEEEMRRSYLDYAMSVIVGRALPDVRDGLKPVHRRVLYAMKELHNYHNKPYKKSARIVGDVIGKYHPHGDTAVYDTIVRMAQSFSLRYPLVDGQGNFGSIDGDNAAAMRYTEVRLAEIAQELMADIDKETVDFGPNYDGSEHEPLIFPTRIPNLLVNGSSGIAVGMATNIPPHNLGEVIDASLALLENPHLTIDELIEWIPAPDFPTKGLIYGVAGIREGYRTGRGRVIMRARTHIEDVGKDKKAIIVDELPYQVNKKTLLEKIAELVREKSIEGISDLRDESDKSGMRIYIELKRNEFPDVVLNHLYKHTSLQDSFGINMVALVEGQPRLLNLKQILEAFLRHRREVITRRTLFELAKARERSHVLEGLAVALSNLDPVILAIKHAASPAEARAALMSPLWRSELVEKMLAQCCIADFKPEHIDPSVGLSEGGYRLSKEQTDAILELKLHRLTGLEQEKILNEYQGIIEKITDYLDLLAKPERIAALISEELQEIRREYGDTRYSEIVPNAFEIGIEDLIKPEERVVTLSYQGYMKTQAVNEYQAQRRGGRGKQASGTKEDDFIEHLLVANTHDYILCFSNLGRVYWLKVYQLPSGGGRTSKGRPIVNLLPLQPEEKITTILPVSAFTDTHSIFMATRCGIVKRASLLDFSHPRTKGIIALQLDEGDYLVGAALVEAKHQVMLFSNAGKAVRFPVEEVRVMGRGARGVKGMTLQANQWIVSLLTPEENTQQVLTATENGYGKRTPVSEYRLSSRGTQGVIAIDCSERNGQLVKAALVEDLNELLLITTGGVLIRTRISEVRPTGRNAQGVKLIQLGETDTLSGVEVLPPELPDPEETALTGVDELEEETTQTPEDAAVE